MDDLPGWIQVGLGAVGIAVTVMFFALDRTTRRPRRSLSFAVLHARPVLTRTGLDVSVRHGDQVIRSPHVIVWRVANGGTEPIAAADFETPLVFTIGGARIVTAEVTHTRPSDLSLSLTIDDHRATVGERLLNPSDMFEVQMLTEGLPDRFSVEGRIAGVSTISQVVLPRTSWDEPWRYSRFDHLTRWVVFLGALTFAGSFALSGNWVLAGVTFPLALLVPFGLVRKPRQNRLFLTD